MNNLKRPSQFGNFEDKKLLCQGFIEEQDPETQVRKIGLTTCSSTMPSISVKRISCDVTTDIIHREIQQFTVKCSRFCQSYQYPPTVQLLTESSMYE